VEVTKMTEANFRIIGGYTELTSQQSGGFIAKIISSDGQQIPPSVINAAVSAYNRFTANHIDETTESELELKCQDGEVSNTNE